MAESILSPGGIYAIRNTINGKVYIGSSIDINRRLKTHRLLLSRGEHHSEKLQRAWNKYGPEVFEFLTLEHASKEDLLRREQYWMDLHRAYSDGYNTCPVAGNILGVKRSPETLAKMSAWQKGIKTGPMRDEIKAKISAAHKGRPKSQKTKAKLSAAHMGKPKSEDHRRKLSIANIGHRHTEETKRKIGEGAKGRIKTPEEREKLSASKMGMSYGPLSDEHKAKIGAASRGRKQSPEWIAKRVASRKANQARKTEN